PHEDLLKDVKTLYVTTSGPLADLPFAAFITAEPQGEDTDTALAATPWLGDRFAIVNLPSVESLRIGRQAPAKRGTLPFIGYGAPARADVGGKRAVHADLLPQGGAAGSAVAVPARLRALRWRPGTEVELNAIARVLGVDAASIHLGRDATETAVRT